MRRDKLFDLICIHYQDKKSFYIDIQLCITTSTTRILRISERRLPFLTRRYFVAYAVSDELVTIDRVVREYSLTVCESLISNEKTIVAYPSQICLI